MNATVAQETGNRGQETEERRQETEYRGQEARDTAVATSDLRPPTSDLGSAGASSSQAGPPSRNATEGVPYSAEPTRRRKRKAWAPSEDDRSIHEWVMLKGETQDFVAQLFGISQPTVSRIVERYEKWQAHAGPREDGGLDPAERLRAQRALTYQRNEKIIRNCLRLAGEVERCKELSHSTTAAPDGGLAGQREIRIVNTMLERTGMASRFYRLAFRVGMEQLELVELEPAAMPAALSEEEEAEQEAQAAADRAELQAVRERNKEEVRKYEQSLKDRLQLAEQEAARAREEVAAAKREMEGVLGLLAQTQRELEAARDAAEGQRDGETEGAELAIRASGEAAVVELKVNKLNNASGAENGASAEAACVCDANGAAEKNCAKVNNGRAPTPALSQRERETAGDTPARPTRGEFMRFIPAG